MITTYIILATLWAVYASYKTSKMGSLGKLPINLFMTFITNILLFPYCLFYAIRHKKF